MERDIPTLQQVVNGTWKKEEDLKRLKSELSTLERKIPITLISKQGIQANKGLERTIMEIKLEEGIKISENSQPVRIRI